PEAANRDAQHRLGRSGTLIAPSDNDLVADACHRMIIADPGTVLCRWRRWGRVAWEPKLLIAYSRAGREPCSPVNRIGVIKPARAGAIVHPDDVNPSAHINVKRRIAPSACSRRVIDPRGAPAPTAIRARLQREASGHTVADYINVVTARTC